MSKSNVALFQLTYLRDFFDPRRKWGVSCLSGVNTQSFREDRDALSLAKQITRDFVLSVYISLLAQMSVFQFFFFFFFLYVRIWHCKFNLNSNGSMTRAA